MLGLLLGVKGVEDFVELALNDPLRVIGAEPGEAKGMKTVSHRVQ